MGEVIQFPKKPESRLTQEAHKLMNLANELDAVILHHLGSGDLDPYDVAGVLAHRLGNLMRTVDEKSKLWDVCSKVARQQAALEQAE